MKQSRPTLQAMLRTTAIVLSLLSASFLILSFVAYKRFADIWQQLGITQADANIDMYVSVMNDGFQYTVREPNRILQKDRVVIVNQLIAYAKKYTSSAEFKKRYEEDRKRAMPKNPNVKPVNVDSIKAVERKNIEQEIKGTEANANNPNSKVRNAVPYRLEQLKKDLKSVDDGTNRVVLYRVKEQQQMNDALTAVYARDLEKFNKNYPANPMDIVKRRLQDLLDITSDVDFNAEVKENPTTKIKYFVNPDYQRKSKEWKLAFRAGKELTDIARAAAQKWLSEIK